jgi:hypothetical protein
MHENDGEVPLNHAMEDLDWVHKESRWVCKINGCTNSYIVKWLLCHHLNNKHELHLEVGKFGHPFTHPRGPRQQDHGSTNARILSNSHARQKRNEKKALDQMKKKMELKWDELQTQAQQMEQVKHPLLICLTFEMSLDIIGISALGGGFIPQSAWVHLEKDENLVETI